MKSLICLPNITCAGLSPVVGSGVLRWARMALARASVSRVPEGPRLSRTRRLAALTATSALLLLCAWYADETLCWMPHLVQNSLNMAEVKMLAPSDEKISAIPNVEK